MGSFLRVRRAFTSSPLAVPSVITSSSLPNAASGREEKVGDPPRLSRFNVHQLRDIEKALAQHLGVNPEHVDQDGFAVVPDSSRLLRITWRASTAISVDDFQSIVDEATVEPADTGPQPRPGRPAPVPKVTRRLPRRSRRPRQPG
jgi:hypothetical protein